jgi:hypothetical protein
MTTATFRLTGDTLVAFVEERKELINRGELSRTDLIKEAGYLNTNGTAAYVDFYTELLRAKGVTPVTDADVNDKAYDDLDSETQSLYDAVEDKLGEKWDHEQIMEFISELDDIGIETADQFEDAFEGVYDSEKDFADQWYTDVMNVQIPASLYSCIDWQLVWDSELRYDFNTIEFDYDTYFFRNI